MSRLLWALAATVLIGGAALMLTAFVTAEERKVELLAVLLFGVPTAALTLFFGAMALVFARPRDRHMIRQTLLALTGSLVTPLAVYAFWQAGPDPQSLLFLALGVGAFVLLVRDLRSGTSGAK